MPLHDVLPCASRGKACCPDDIGSQQGGGGVMTTSTRRDFLKTTGMLVVSLGASFTWPEVEAEAAGPYPDPNFRQLDSWIVIRDDNTATFYVGKTDCGQGTGTAFR